MSTWLRERGDGNPGNPNGSGNKNNCFDHMRSLLKTGQNLIKVSLRLGPGKDQNR
jgi:hypothetical protein